MSDSHPTGIWQKIINLLVSYLNTKFKGATYSILTSFWDIRIITGNKNTITEKPAAADNVYHNIQIGFVLYGTKEERLEPEVCVSQNGNDVMKWKANHIYRFTIKQKNNIVTNIVWQLLLRQEAMGFMGYVVNFKKHKLYQYHYQSHDIKLSQQWSNRNSNYANNDILMLKWYV